MPVDICLVSPPQRAYNHHRPPLALMFLAAFLEKQRIDARIIDPIAKHEVFGESKIAIEDKIIEEAVKFAPPIVGISCYTPEFNDVLELAGKIKKNINTKIIIGGVHPTLRPDDFFFKDSPVDFVVIGEGENTLAELTRAILNKESNFEKINGIGYFDRSKGIYRQTGVRILIDDLDDLPFPAYDKVDMNYYTAPNPYAVRGLLFSSFYILVGRGCPSQCSFCVSAQMRKILSPEKPLRCRSPKNVVDEIESLKDNYKIDSFYFIDDNFTLRRDLVFGICEELEKRRMNLIWSCSARINSLSLELLRKMKNSGCVQIDLGVESGSDDVLKRLKKQITVKQIKEVFDSCHQIGIRTFANILINVPGETENEIEETLMLLDQIKPSVTSFNIFIPYLGTEIYGTENVNLGPNEYYLLGEPPRKLLLDSRFRFAKHSLNFNDFYRRNHKRYNRISNFLRSYFSWYYIRQLSMSRRKKDYFLQLGELAGEYFKQIGL